MLSGLAIAGIIFFTLAIVTIAAGGLLYYFGKLDFLLAAQEQSSDTEVTTNVTTVVTTDVTADMTTDVTSEVAVSSDYLRAPPVMTPVAPTPPPSVALTPPSVAPTPPPSVAPAVQISPEILYVDRGCWKDGGFLYGSPLADPEDPFNRALGTENVFDVDPNLPPEQYFSYGVQLAVAGKFDTFAFTQGGNGVELRLSNYGSTDSRGNVCKYDKFGPDSSGTICAPAGDFYVNRVYSMIRPYSTPLGFTRFETDQFIDRGCYNDGDPYNAYKLQGAITTGGPVAGAYIMLDSTGEPQENWINYARQLAVEGCYDTFAFQTDSLGSVFLYLGYYGTVYRYDRFGKMTTTAVTCSDFGGINYIRVYSARAPALTTTSSSLQTLAASWLKKLKK